MNDKAIRIHARSKLHPDAFRRRPLQALWLILMLGVTSAGTAAVIRFNLAWSVALLLGVILGHTYASLFFFGHYLLHGSMIKRRWLQDMLMFPCTAILGLSPHLWRVWHHHAHHPHTNVPGQDPDNFGTHDDYQRSTLAKLLMKIAPGNAHWLSSLLYLTTFFNIHAQGVLWMKSRTRQSFSALNRRRAIVETAGIYAWWIALAWYAGPGATLFVVVIPWAVANYVTLSYIVTQHLLRPIGPRNETLTTTMSLTVPRLFDWIHWFNSHHVEHHLFPSLPYSELPSVRRILLRSYPGQYFAPSYGRALLAVLLTPRIYDGDALIDPQSSRRVTFEHIEAVLRGRRRLGTLHPMSCNPLPGRPLPPTEPLTAPGPTNLQKRKSR